MATYRENTGLLGINDRKQKENHPDYNGKIYVSKPGLYYLKGWKKQGKSGQPLLSLAADYAPEDKQLEASENVQERPAFTPNIDDAPF
tara:strand:+ start:220 stop:483 length:264 start_codon:yes stop_codon:yes gene_type:complete